MRWPSGAITAHCSGAHQRMHMAMSLCSGPQHGAADARRAPHDTRQKKKRRRCRHNVATVGQLAARRKAVHVPHRARRRRTQNDTKEVDEADSAAWTGPLHVESRPRCPRCLPCVLLSKKVPAADPNHRSDVVLEHSSRSDAHEPRCRPRRRQLPFSFLRSLADACIDAGTNVTSPQAHGHGSGRDCGSTSPCRLSGASPEVRRRPASKRTSATASARNRPKTLRPTTAGVFGGERSATCFSRDGTRLTGHQMVQTEQFFFSRVLFKVSLWVGQPC